MEIYKYNSTDIKTLYQYNTYVNKSTKCNCTTINTLMVLLINYTPSVSKVKMWGNTTGSFDLMEIYWSMDGGSKYQLVFSV